MVKNSMRNVGSKKRIYCKASSGGEKPDTSPSRTADTAPAAEAPAERPPLVIPPSPAYPAELGDTCFVGIQQSLDLGGNFKPSQVSSGLFHKPQTIISTQVRKMMPPFLSAIIDDNRDAVTKMLTQCPKLLLLNPQQFMIEPIQSQHTWQTFKPMNPLVFALARNQVEMIKVMKPFIDQLAEKGSDEKIQALWQQAEQIRKIQQHRSKSFNFKQLIDVLSQETFANGTGMQNPLSEATENALQKFRKSVLPQANITPFNYYDIEQLLLTAMQAYYTHFNDFGDEPQWGRRDQYWVKVIGFIQSLLSPEDAKAWCEGMDVVVKDTDRQISERAAGLTLALREHNFYRISSESSVGLGRTFAASWTGLPAVGAHHWDWDSRQYARVCRDYVKQKQDTLQAYTEASAATKSVALTRA